MDTMVELLEKFNLPEGMSHGPMEGVYFYKSSEPLARTPRLYDPGICILAQGSKTGYLAGRRFHYDSNNYLVTTMAMPFECETHACREKPMLGFFVAIDMALLGELIHQLGMRRFPGNSLEALGPAPFEPEFQRAAVQLLQSMHSEEEIRVLGRQRKRELYYRVLSGPQAPALHALFNTGGHFAKIAKIVGNLHQNYADRLVVDDLAAQVHMSPSTFHRAFRDVTSDTPIQYLKKLRLNKARDFMMEDSMTVYMAADKVGYESVSQFSREFKRYFGQSPGHMSRLGAELVEVE